MSKIRSLVKYIQCYGGCRLKSVFLDYPRGQGPVAYGEEAFSDREVARVVLALDEAVALKRRAAISWLTAPGDAVPILPGRPSRIELAVLTALAQTYGAALLEQSRQAGGSLAQRESP
jgi:hypothetical protein